MKNKNCLSPGYNNDRVNKPEFVYIMPLCVSNKLSNSQLFILSKDDGSWLKLYY